MSMVKAIDQDLLSLWTEVLDDCGTSANDTRTEELTT
jgi:hypothetical protein